MEQDEAELAAYGWEFRLAEQERGTEVWFAVEPGQLPAAAALHEKGWFARRMGDSAARQNAEWRLTDRAMLALRVDAATSGQCLN